MQQVIGFEYGTTQVQDIHVKAYQSETKKEPTLIEMGGIVGKPSGRFWRSFAHLFAVPQGIFKYFDHHEVFDRVSKTVSNDKVRYCVEKRADGKPGSLLALSNPTRSVLRQDDIDDLLTRHGGQDIRYHEGIYSSFHNLPQGRQRFDIGADSFDQRFFLEQPVDGYGCPRIFLSMQRLLCTNGMIGYSRVFRSDINTGKDTVHNVERALQTFNYGDGYTAFRQRLESAQNSLASVNECNRVAKMLTEQVRQGNFTHPAVLRDFNQVTGSLNQFYGVTNLEALSVKRQRLLPARCRIYDLLNFVSELATHYAKPESIGTLQAWIGTLISDEYDLEGSVEAEQAPEFQDFLLDTKMAA